MKTPMMKNVMMAVWLITALASINELLAVLGYDFLSYVAMNMPGLSMPLIWVIGISGIVSLIMWIMSLQKCMCCGKEKCTCGRPSGQQGGQGMGM